MPFKKGDRFGEIESVKAVSELFVPVSGRIVEVNSALIDHVEMVASDPYGQGWMIKLKLGSPAEASKLLNASEYDKHVEAQS